ncbi:MAG: polyprenyl synthetase family protein, partial [Longimicrobiales bacterium]
RQVAAGCGALRLDAERTRANTLELARAAGAGGMVGGQWLDLLAEGSTVGAGRLEAIHGRKTGALFAAAARMGGLLAGADAGTIQALGAYGDALGLAFQIADDVLDVTGDADVLGKSPGKDRAQAKATYPALLGVGGAERKAEATIAAGEAALEAAGIADPALRALLRFAVDRER